MAQERFFEFRDDDLTKRLDNWLLGINYPGRYVGFDKVETDNLILRLGHTETGLIYNDGDNNPKPPIGLTVSKAGVIVKEDSEIDITVQPNNNANSRIDIVYMQHRYRDGVVGGEQAVYGYIVGSPSTTPVPPSLPDPTIQVVVGYLFWPGSTVVNDSTVRWEQEKSPLPNKGEYNNQSKDKTEISVSGAVSRFDIYPQKTGDYFTVSIENSNDSSHTIIIHTNNNTDTVLSYMFEFTGNDTLDENFSVQILQSTNGDFITLDTLTRIELSNTNIKIKYRKVGSDFVRTFRSYEDSHQRGGQNRSEFGPIMKGLVDKQQSGLSVITNNNKYWPSYIIANNSQITHLQQLDDLDPEPGTKVIIEAGDDNGFILLNDSSLVGAPDGQKKILFGTSESYSLGFRADNDGSDLYVTQGSVVELIYTSFGVWTVLNKSEINRVKGLENQLKSSITTINSHEHIFVDGQEVRNLINFDQNPAAGVTPLDGEIELPNDNITRRIIVWGKSSWNRKTTGGTNVQGRQWIYRDSTRLDDARTENANTDQNSKGYDDTLSGMAIFDHTGNGGTMSIRFWAVGDQYDITDIKMTIIGTPFSLIG